MDPGSDGDPGAEEKSALDLADIQGFVLRAYRMPLVRHFLLTVGIPHTRAGSSDGSSAATNPTPRRSPLPRTGMSGSRPDRETIPPMPRVTGPTIASTSVSRGPDWSRWR